MLDLSDQGSLDVASHARRGTLRSGLHRMTAPVSRVSVSTVAARQRPAPKGEGRPVGTPLTVLEGFVEARGTSSAGLAPGRTWLVAVELEDENGLVGVGTAGFGHPATVELLRQLEPLVVGRAPSEVAHIWETMYRSTLNIGRRGIALHAISAVDIALWDLFGKQLGVPSTSCSGASCDPHSGLCELAVRDRGPRCPGSRSGRAGRPRASGR